MAPLFTFGESVRKVIAIAICVPLLIAYIAWSRNRLNAARRPPGSNVPCLSPTILSRQRIQQSLWAVGKVPGRFIRYLGVARVAVVDRQSRRTLGCRPPDYYQRPRTGLAYAPARRVPVGAVAPRELLENRGPRRSGNRSQPLRPLTNEASAAAGPGH